jgi:hypothetical protein
MNSESDELAMNQKSQPLKAVAGVSADQARQMAIYRNGQSQSSVRQRDPRQRFGAKSPMKRITRAKIPNYMNSASSISGRR